MRREHSINGEACKVDAVLVETKKPFGFERDAKMASLEQKRLCEKYGVAPVDAPSDLKAGVAGNVRSRMVPLNGLRHPPTAGMTGWYIRAGERLSTAPEFFQPQHLRHVEEWRPAVEKYLALPPGWRFLVAEDYEDVWYEPALLILE